MLAERLAFLTDEPPAHRYGRVFVATLDDARGRSFEVVFVPGLAERIFPQRPREDPLLLDARAARLAAASARRRTTAVDRERLLLRLAVGAAARRVVALVPARRRRAGAPARPLVLRARRRARDAGRHPRLRGARARAPRRGRRPPRLAGAARSGTRHRRGRARPRGAGGAAARARPARGRRAARSTCSSSTRTSPARCARATRAGTPSAWSDAATASCASATAPAPRRSAAHRLTARSYSPTALQHFAACPYRFFLAAIHRLAPRREAAPLEELDPLTRGTLFHDVQSETLRALARAGAAAADGGAPRRRRARARRDARRRRGAASRRARAGIPRVWEDEIAALRADLRDWLRRLADDADGWHPRTSSSPSACRADAARDPHSQPDAGRRSPGGIRLRGSIDLVERRADGRALRVTDHKTGSDRTDDGHARRRRRDPPAGPLRARRRSGAATAGQRGAPLLLHRARRLRRARRAARRPQARAQGRDVLETIDRALADGFLPAGAARTTPARAATSARCAARTRRSARAARAAQPLADLAALRELP